MRHCLWTLGPRGHLLPGSMILLDYLQFMIEMINCGLDFDILRFRFDIWLLIRTFSISTIARF